MSPAKSESIFSLLIHPSSNVTRSESTGSLLYLSLDLSSY